MSVHPSKQVDPSLWCIALCLLLSAATSGCSGEQDARPSAAPLANDGMGGAPPHVSQSGACAGDETIEKECTVYITQASGVLSCFKGIQYCDAGTWSSCIDPENDPRND